MVIVTSFYHDINDTLKYCPTLLLDVTLSRDMPSRQLQFVQDVTVYKNGHYLNIEQTRKCLTGTSRLGNFLHITSIYYN